MLVPWWRLVLTVRPHACCLAAVLVPLVVLLAGCGERPAPPAPHEVAFAAQVAPVMADYCVTCHGGDEPDGGLSFDAYADGSQVPGFEDLRARTSFFERLTHHVVNGSMPPEGMPAPPPEVREAMVGWFTDTLAEAWRVAPPDPGRVTMRRLNRVEYRNTVRDLLGVDYDTTRTFPTDDVGYGFDHIGDVLSMPPILLEKYLDAAETIAAKAAPLPRRRFEAELVHTTSNSPPRGGVAVLNSEFEVFTDVRISEAGEYAFRVRATAQQAGPDPAEVSFRVRGKEVHKVAVKSPKGTFEEHETLVRLGKGRQRISVGFANDWWRPNHPDPKQRDRNLYIDWFELEPAAGLAREKTIEREGRLLSCLPAKGEETLCAETILGPLLTRAFRRPPTPVELQRYVGLVLDTMAAGESFEGGIQTALQAILVAPQFLFRMELDEGTGGTARPLDPYELASRLSYFLWASTPDDVLLASAEAGTLKASIHDHVTRMLNDPRARTLVTNFASQWLTLRRLETATPDPRMYKHVTDAMRGWMRQETELFVEAVFREDRSILDLIDAPFTYVNQPLAEYYRIGGVKGGEFRRVDVDPSERGGLLGHASILTITSYPHRTSPVLRGKWVMEALLGTPPPPPPPGVGTLEEQKPEMLKRSVRERLAAHREDPACAVCHDGMDNLGYGLENYDPVGQWREVDGSNPIDASGVLPGEQAFDGPAELKQILRAHPGVPRGFAEQLLTYALGRGLEPYDRPAVMKIVQEARDRRFRFRAFVHAIVATDAFTMRRTTEAAR